MLRDFPIGHVGPYEVIAPFNPMQILTLPSEQGIPFGTTEFKTGFWFDPHYLMLRNLCNGTSVTILGDRNSGKTATAQTFGYRSSGIQAPNSTSRKRVAADDTRRNAGVGEYEKWAKALGGTYTDLSKARFNPLDPKMGMNVKEQQFMMRSALQVVSHRQLKSNVRTVLLAALQVMNEDLHELSSIDVLTSITSTLTLAEYKTFLKRRTSELLKRFGDKAADPRLRALHDREAINLSPSSFRAACQQLTELLIILLEEYGEVFGPTNSLYDVLTQPVVALDFTGLDEDTIPLVEMLLWMWRNAAIRRNDHNLMAHVEIHDENWKRWENLTYGSNMINHLKKIRGSGVIIIKNMHRPSDVNQVGAEGSRERALAMSGLRETDIWFVGKTPRIEHESLRAYTQLPQKYLNQTPHLTTGEFIVKIGDILPPFRLHLDLSSIEREMIESNAASMANL